MTKDSPEMRASDADRDVIAERLREGFAEGRLDTEEFEQRLEAAYTARTHSELEPLVRDLPKPGSATGELDTFGNDSSPAKRWAGRFGGKSSSRFGIGVMGGFVRKGQWTMPRAFNCFALWGGGEIDLREARFEQREVVVRATALMGGVNVIVPHDAEVEISGIGIMGGFDHTAAGAGVAEGPRIIITGLAIWGGVGVERKRPQGSPELDKGEGPREIK